MTKAVESELFGEVPNTRETEEIKSLEDLITEGVDSTKNPEDLSMDTLTLLILNESLHHLEKKTMSEIQELKQRQDDVRYLHKLLQEINANTSNKGELDLKNNPEVQKMLEKAKEMGIEFTDKNGKYYFTKDQRDRLVENIRMHIDDLNVQNDMQLQTVSRLTNERYEMYQMARSILKPLHEDRIQKARAMAGRGG